MSLKDQDLPSHLIGTPAFFPALLSYIRSLSNSTTLPLDQVIIKSILLCIVGGKNLILRTPEEDIGLVVKLVFWTLASVFNYPTHKVKIRSHSGAQSANATTASFLRSLLLPVISHDEVARQLRHPRSSSMGSSKLLTPEYLRSLSYPNDLAQAHSRASVVSQPYGTDRRSRSDIDPILASSPRLQHSFTDPAPIPRKQASFSIQDQKPLELPRALVICGLDKAPASTQHALVKLLSEKRVVVDGDEDDDENGVWNLPADFILVYVCSNSSKERPPVHKSLLDKFAMSHNIFISQSVRHALRSLPFSPIHPPSHSPSFSYSNPGSPSASYPIPLPQTYTPPYLTKPLPSSGQPIRRLSISNPFVFAKEVFPPSFLETLQESRRRTHFPPSLELYLSDLFSATRHHPRLDGTLLTATARKDAEDLARAARVLGTDLTGMELIRLPTLKGDEFSEYDAQSVQYHRKVMDESSTTHLLRRDSISRVSWLPSVADAYEESETIPVLDVTEADIARVMPRVVTHRLRLRDGPEEEVLASAVVGATFGGNFTQDGDGGDSSDAPGTGTERSFKKGYGGLTIKDILVDILHKV